MAASKSSLRMWSVDTQAIIGLKGRRSSEGVMENLRRKEHDTSTTVSEEGSLVGRTELHLPFLRGDVVTRRRLIDQLGDAFRSHRLTLVSAPQERLA